MWKTLLVIAALLLPFGSVILMGAWVWRVLRPKPPPSDPKWGKFRGGDAVPRAKGKVICLDTALLVRELRDGKSP
jgi:hypothetical protein